jgi:hypothetical protein
LSISLLSLTNSGWAVDKVEAPASNQLVPDTRKRRISDRALTGAVQRAPRLVRRVASLGR